MALIRVAQYNYTPTVVEDYQAQNAHLQAFTNQLMTQQFILDAGTAQPVIKQGCYVSHGGSLYIADADTAITGSPADGSVYIRVSGTTSLTVEFVNDISGYTWNPVYTALTSGSYTLLPYLIVKASSVWTRYNLNPNNQSFGDTRLNSLAVTGAISGTSLDTGQGANELYAMNQDLETTDSVEFAHISPNSSTHGSWSILGYNLGTPTQIIPKGIYNIYSTSLGTNAIVFEIYNDSSWITCNALIEDVCYAIISDGTNVRLRNTFSNDTYTVYYRKF